MSFALSLLLEASSEPCLNSHLAFPLCLHASYNWGKDLGSLRKHYTLGLAPVCCSLRCVLEAWSSVQWYLAYRILKKWGFMGRGQVTGSLPGKGLKWFSRNPTELVDKMDQNKCTNFTLNCALPPCLTKPLLPLVCSYQDAILCVTYPKRPPPNFSISLSQTCELYETLFSYYLTMPMGNRQIQ